MSTVILETIPRYLNNPKKIISYREEDIPLSSENDKTFPKQDLNLKASKELLEKYGRKEEYNYFGLKVRAPLKLFNIFFIVSFHLGAIYGTYVFYERRHTAHVWKNIALGIFLIGVSAFGATGGAHRYWTHRSYKATLPMRILLILCYSTSGHNPIPVWVRDHRVHHKYSDTDADPHSANRGLFFSHAGWLMMKKLPEVLEKGKKVDMSDIQDDQVVQFHTKYFLLIQPFFTFFVPTLIPVYLWNEEWFVAFLGQAVIRYVYILNMTWAINSFGHFLGNRPYHGHINPTETKFLAFIAMGDGWHNYHHAFPWDYKAAELPYHINITTFWLDVFAKIGWVYDRKAASPSLIKATALKYGDGSRSEKELQYDIK